MTPNKTRKRRRTSKNRLFRRYPRWVIWVGGMFFAFFYMWFFYEFFVSPTGFRWRALFGDPDYPEGYEIHGIDISHYQGEIDWHLLKLSLIHI